MTSVHRVVVSQDTYKALQAEAMVRRSSIQAVMDSIIIDHISQKAREILKTLESVDDKAAKTYKPIKPESQQSTKAGRPKQLAKDAAGIARLKDLYSNTDSTVADIARDIDRPRQTVEALIDRLIAKGELSQRAESRANVR